MTYRILATGDWHADASLIGVRRHDEVRRQATGAVRTAVQERVDLFLFLGDLSDPDTGGDTFHAIELALDCALRLARAGIRSVWLRGNHDVVEDAGGGCTVTPMRAVEGAYPDLVHVAVEPRALRLAGDLTLLCLPFSPAARAYDPEEAAGRLWPARGRVVVAGHLMLVGIHPGSETTDMPRGREVFFPPRTRDAYLRICGHYHHRQVFDPGDGGPPWHIPGTLARLTFGEQDNVPGYMLIDVPDAP